MKIKSISVIYALAAALFYALSTPFSKLLLENISPLMLAAFLYLGAGIGVGIMYLFKFRDEKASEKLAFRDAPYTVAMVLLDIAAPILMMLGIKFGDASSASLLGNFEIVATTVIALCFFKEKVSATLWCAIGLITLSSFLLTTESLGEFEFSIGSVLVICATLCWGLENNCTRKISGKSTYQIVIIKGIFSGMGSLIIALISGEEFSDFIYILLAMLLGFVAYGISIFTYIRAQRTLGAAKTSAFYAVAPFIGAFLSFVILGEGLSLWYFISLAIMIAGTVLVVVNTMKNE